MEISQLTAVTGQIRKNPPEKLSQGGGCEALRWMHCSLVHLCVGATQDAPLPVRSGHTWN